MRIVWAVDPFDANPSVQRPLGEWLVQLARQSRKPLEVEPLYVLSQSELALSDRLGRTSLLRYRPLAERAVEQMLRGIDGERRLPARVLVRTSPTLRDSVRALSRYAENLGATAVAVTTHARRGVDRVFLGSFTETLLNQSRLPVLTLGPRPAAVRRVRRILWATDLAEDADRHFDQLAAFAAGIGADITLYHALTAPLAPVIQAGVYLTGGGWVPAASYLKEEYAEQEKHAHRLAARGARHGVRVRVRIEDSDESRPDTILREIRAGKHELVAMAARTGPVGAALHGSIVRQVIRHSSLPVLVLKAEARSRR